MKKQHHHYDKPKNNFKNIETMKVSALANAVLALKVTKLNMKNKRENQKNSRLTSAKLEDNFLTSKGKVKCF